MYLIDSEDLHCTYTP